jgi:crossover junction endodeoxyribonuclease RusA
MKCNIYNNFLGLSLGLLTETVDNLEMECTLELPWPQSVNHFKKVGRIVRTKKGKLYQKRINSDATKQFYRDVWVKICALKATTANWRPIESTIALEVSISLYPPDKRRRDIDNPVKLILDSLQRGGLIEDDYAIARLLIERCNILPEGKVIVRIKELVCT